MVNWPQPGQPLKYFVRLVAIGFSYRGEPLYLFCTKNARTLWADWSVVAIASALAALNSGRRPGDAMLRISANYRSN